MSAPEQIWIAGPMEECGNYYAEAVEAEGDHGGVAVEYTRTDLSKAAVAAALEGAARTGYVTCAETRHVLLGQAVEKAIRALITAPQRDALQAVIDAAVAEARAEDAATIAEYRAALSDWDRHGGQVQHERLLAAEAALAQIGAKL